MSEYKFKKGKVGEKFVGAYKKIEETFIDAFLQKSDETESGYVLKTGKVGEKVVSSYKSIENGVVGSYKKIEDKFVDVFLEEVSNEYAESGPKDRGEVKTIAHAPKGVNESSKNALEFSREISEKYTHTSK